MDYVKCQNCKRYLTDEELKVSFEQREKGKEEIVEGYKCHCCGHRGEF